jgi:hypothetical protein
MQPIPQDLPGSYCFARTPREPLARSARRGGCRAIALVPRENSASAIQSADPLSHYWASSRDSNGH